MKIYTPASFTKNLGLGLDYQKLQGAIAHGFQGELKPVTRRDWRQNAGMDDRYRELIPLDFFLFSARGAKDDYVLPDELVQQSMTAPHSKTFDRLALFAFHFAQSGTWRNSMWDDGRVAGWSNEFIREVVWQNSAWQRAALTDECVLEFIASRVQGTDKTHTKMFTNYRHMLRISGVFDGLMADPIDLQPEQWGAKACMIVWDRMAYGGKLDKFPNRGNLISVFLHEEVYKLLGCSKKFGLEIAGKAADDYLNLGTINRFVH
jgi:hypothetical protein